MSTTEHGSPWVEIAGPMLHPADEHLKGRSVYIHGGALVRHKTTGRYALAMGGSIRSVPQDWARDVARILGVTNL